MLEFEPGLLIWTSISFLLLVILLYKVALPPLLAFLAQREKEIADGLAQAAVNQAKAAALEKEYNKKLAEANQLATTIINNAKGEGEKKKGEIVAQANKEAAFIVNKTKQELDREKEKIIGAARQEIVGLVTVATGRLLRRQITGEDNDRLIENSLKEIKQ